MEWNKEKVNQIEMNEWIKKCYNCKHRYFSPESIIDMNEKMS